MPVPTDLKHHPLTLILPLELGGKAHRQPSTATVHPRSVFLQRLPTYIHVHPPAVRIEYHRLVRPQAMPQHRTLALAFAGQRRQTDFALAHQLRQHGQTTNA